MCSNQIITIKVKSYLKKYLIKLYGDEPVKFPQRHNYNRFLIQRLSKTGKHFFKKINDKSDYIEIMLPFNELKDIRSYNYLSEENKIAFRKDAMGGGDVKLMAMVGSFLGTKLVLLSIFLGSLFGAMVGGMLILFRLKTRKDYIPFGPYLALGAVIALFFGEKILGWYFGLLTG